MPLWMIGTSRVTAFHVKRAITPRLSAIAKSIKIAASDPHSGHFLQHLFSPIEDLTSQPVRTRSSLNMAGLIIGLVHILQKVLCGAGNVDGKPNQGSNDYYHNQQQQQQQGFPPLQSNNYPPQQAIGRPPQQQNAWNGQHHNGQQNAWNGQHTNAQQGYGYQQHNNNLQNGPYKASNQANLQRPNYQGPSGLVGGAILGPHSKLVGIIASFYNSIFTHPLQDPNMVNQSNAHYTSLRSQARQHGDRAHQLFQQSQAAYQAGDGARAHELSEEGKAEMRKKDQVDDEAEEWIYRGMSLWVSVSLIGGAYGGAVS